MERKDKKKENRDRGEDNEGKGGWGEKELGRP